MFFTAKLTRLESAISSKGSTYYKAGNKNNNVYDNILFFPSSTLSDEKKELLDFLVKDNSSLDDIGFCFDYYSYKNKNGDYSSCFNLVDILVNVTVEEINL